MILPMILECRRYDYNNVSLDFIHSSYIIFKNKMAINNLELQWWWCCICFGVWWWLFACFYSPLFIVELRNTLNNFMPQHTCDFTRTETSTNSKTAFIWWQNIHIILQSYLLLVFFVRDQCLLIGLHNKTCANTHIIQP